MTNSLKLKAYLLLSGLRQEDLARYLNISIQSINLKINNKRPFKPSEIVKTCEFLKIHNMQERFSIFFADNVD